MKSGIYQIRNLLNNKIYIGSASDFYHREATHFSRLRSNKHHSPHLQSSFNKNGKDSFRFEVLINCPPEYLLKMEQWFIDKLKPEYNICPLAGRSTGVKYRDNLERCFKVGKATRKLTEEQAKEVIKLSKEGKSNKEIASIYNLDPTGVSRILSGRMYRHLRLEEKPINKNIKPNKLKDKSLVLIISRELETGISQYVIAKKYSIDQSTISRIKTKSRNFSWLRENE